MTTDGAARRGWRVWAPRATLAVLLLCALAVAGMYVRGGRTSAGVVLAGGLPVTIAVALVAAALHWRHHGWLRLGVVAAILVSQAPLLDHLVDDGTPSEPRARTIRVATLNTQWSGPTDAELAELASGTDVLALQEWEPERTDGLTEALGEDWRLVASDHDDYIGADVAVWARRPWQVRSAAPLAGRQPGSSLQLSRGEDHVTVIGTRLQNPAFLAADRWGEGLDSLRHAVEDADGPVIVLGDLNAPPSAVAFRRFARDADLRPCTAQLGLGFPGTWGREPGSAVAPVPIDHALTRHATCTDLEIRRERGSDHRALTATVALD